MSYAPKLPLVIDETNNFKYITNALENAKQKLKMIILTNPGEKIMSPRFGIGVYKYLFEPDKGILNISGDTNRVFTFTEFSSTLETNLKEQVRLYASEIEIESVSAETVGDKLSIAIKYKYLGSIADVLVVNLER